MNTLLANPYRVSISYPKQISCRGLTEMTLAVKHADECESTFTHLSEPYNVAGLYNILRRVIMRYQWQEIIDSECMLFVWDFDGHRYESSNPFVELFFRCVRMIAVMLKQTVNGCDIVDQGQLDKIVSALNVAIKGSMAAVPYCQDFVVVPALLMPPHLRPCHSSLLMDTDIEVVPTLTTHTLQVIVYMIVTHTWINSVVEDIQKILTGPKFRLLPREDRVSHTQTLLSRIFHDVLTAQNNPLTKREDYLEYIEKCLGLKGSDYHTITCIAEYVCDKSNRVVQTNLIDRFDSISYDMQDMLIKTGIKPRPPTQVVDISGARKEIFIFHDISEREDGQDIVSKWEDHQCDFSVDAMTKCVAWQVDQLTGVKVSQCWEKEEEKKSLIGDDRDCEKHECCVIL